MTLGELMVVMGTGLLFLLWWQVKQWEHEEDDDE